jgi:hypothetical protein
MRILFDTAVPIELRDTLSQFEVLTRAEMGWAELDTAALLDAMTDQFDALVTLDQRLPQQHYLQDAAFGVIVLRPASSAVSDALALAPTLLAELIALEPGTIREVW